MIGHSLSHYNILEELGRGGMGIVYKAEDTKLDRTVAIKVLPSAALSSEDDRERFYREAKAAAQLQHPHIAGVFEIDEAVPVGSSVDDLRPFIAMEFIEGETLRANIDRRPLKMEDAIRIAGEIASALEAAHEKNIVHRDIKSANVMLTKKNSAKVLDFGLAKTAQSTMLTRMGSTLGTVTYMSPEQSRGEEVDLRTDIWSLGVVLYEMVAGKHPFGGDYEQAVVYSILNEAPEPLTAVRTGVPMMLEWLVNKCLAKKADDRYQSCSDVLVDLRSVTKETSKTTGAQPSAIHGSGVSGQTPTHLDSPSFSPSHSRSSPELIQHGLPVKKRAGWILPAAVVSALTIGLLAGLFLQTRGNFPAGQPVQRVKLLYPNLTRIFRPAVSPDGTKLAYTSIDITSAGTAFQVHIQDLATGEDQRVPLEQGGFKYGPSFSPDGEWIAFFSGADEAILKVRSEGGATTLAVSSSDTWMINWTADNDILYTDEGILYLSPEAGTGDIELLAPDSLYGDGAFFDPVPVDSRTILLSRISNTAEVSIIWYDRVSGERGTVLKDAAVYDVLDDGFLLYFRTGGGLVIPAIFANNSADLTAQRFDRNDRRIYGSPITLDGIGELSTVSNQGTLYYAPVAGGAFEFSLAWLSPDGSQEPLGFDPGGFDDIAVSPDGSTLAVEVLDESSNFRNIFLFDLASGTRQRLTLTGDNVDPSWSPDGRFVTFYSIRDGGKSIYMKPASGAGDAVKLVDIQETVLPVPEWTPDGKKITFTDQLSGEDNGPSVHLLDIETGEITRIAAAENAGAARVSPDGKYIAFVYTGTPQAVHVVSIDGSARYELVSEGAHYPRWTRDGKGIYFRRGGTLLFHEVTTEPVFRKIGDERIVALLGGGFDHFPSPVDDRVLISAVEDQVRGSAIELNVVINWVEELKRLLPE